MRRFVAVGTTDSADLLELFQRHVTRLENTVRWTWAPGDIAIWDNRATQHYAVADYDNHPRLLHRVTLAGDVPIGLDGSTSTVHKGDASEYSPVVEPVAAWGRWLAVPALRVRSGGTAAGLQVRQHVAGEQVALGGMGIARQDERLHPEPHVGAQLGPHLVGIADDRRTRTRAGASDAGPQVGLDEALIVGVLAQFALAAVAGRAGVERAGADHGAREAVKA